MILAAPPLAARGDAYLVVALEYLVLGLALRWLWRRLRRPPPGRGDLPRLVVAPPPAHPSFAPPAPRPRRRRVARATPSPVVPPGLAWVLDWDQLTATCPACRKAYRLPVVLDRMIAVARRTPVSHPLDTLPVTCPGCDYEAQLHVGTGPAITPSETPHDAR